MILRVGRQGLAAASAALVALATWLATGYGAALPVPIGVVSAAADPVLLGNAAALSALGDEHAEIAADAIEELACFAIGMGEFGVSYAVGDAVAAWTHVGWGGL
ncbi:PE family protein [Mycobacterium decipiens]|uniref:PE domain-containing protein n=1 Tax=Mycobacterium decipiens TaxID=1430326 RepID=A0A1X2LUW2_9MYCO|nr:PE family protein [Mycobacterium decipiens]OSC40835.1 hypothetical protein B8W66_11715 [Mycobacterium decipiens]